MEGSKVKYLKAVTNLVLAVIVILLLIYVLPKVAVFFMPFICGWVIAWIASPMVRFCEEKLKIKRKTGSAAVIVLTIGLVVLALYLVGAKLVREGTGLMQDLPDMWEGLTADIAIATDKFSAIYDKFPIDVQKTLTGIKEGASEAMGSLIEKISSPTIEAVGNFAKKLPTIIIAVIMCLLSSYFFVADKSQVTEWIRSAAPKGLVSRYDIIRRSVARAVGGYFKAQFKIELWIYLLLVIGLSFLKVRHVLLIAAGIALLDILPFFGTGTVMVPWAIIKVLSGDYTMAIALVVIWGVGQLVRQIIQPKIVGDSIGVPPIPTLFLLYIGFKVGGVIGMIVAVPVGLIIFTMYEEGVFDTTRNSILILVNGLNRFRKVTPEDVEESYHGKK
ncbi:MAG: sporulation integral membrane protein YtvI [Lachnospiraceae bacterium]|nr:sporulation integral membrane protein YtvI [Lachnospiraceae bacterium]